MSDPEFTQMLQSVGSTGAQSIADNELDLMVAASSSSSSEDVQPQQQAAAATARNMRLRYFELHVVDVLRRESQLCRAAATTVFFPPLLYSFIKFSFFCVCCLLSEPPHRCPATSSEMARVCKPDRLMAGALMLLLIVLDPLNASNLIHGGESPP